ncbi:hypothetical protein Pfo_022339 [Paulownia fortunei]|nr:hypothetical protein Pfo_022339 [Paulownia fortunei]
MARNWPPCKPTPPPLPSAQPPPSPNQPTPHNRAATEHPPKPFQFTRNDHKARGSGLAPLPVRLTAPLQRLADFGYSSEMFEKDTELWGQRVDNYWSLLSPKIRSDTLRNMMDMKTHLGSFAAALKDKNVWVMNVAEDGPKMPKIVYDRA